MHQGGWCIRTCRPLPSAPTLAQHARHAPARGRAPFLRGASRAVRTSVPLASFALAGGASRLLSNICPSASAGARRHPAGRLRMLGAGVVKF
ncbi:hypothetical protein PERCYII40_0595 [Pseudomonas aeruginosa]|nr:hypothetical protein PERCYII40_0595 [Pseudomonas aeruginosa]